MSTEESMILFIRTSDSLRKEIRKASKLPITQMNQRLDELLCRSRALSREVTKFLEQKDKQ